MEHFRSEEYLDSTGENHDGMGSQYGNRQSVQRIGSSKSGLVGEYLE